MSGHQAEGGANTSVVDLRLRTQEAAVLFQKDRCIELGDSYCKPFDLSQNECEL